MQADGAIGNPRGCPRITEARTGRLRRELELLRSHPKDERGSVREIGLCLWMATTLHFSRLSPTVWTELTNCPKWSFSGRLGSPEMDSFGNPKWSHLETENELIWEPKMDSCEDRFGDRKLIHWGTEMISFWDDQTRDEMKFL